MSEMTPETLMIFANVMDGILGPGPGSEDIRAHASAWKADRKRIEALEKARKMSRVRIKVVEKARKKTRAEYWRYRLYICGAAGKTLDEDAALAAEGEA